MYILAINGSPRKGGNTENMLHKVIAPLDEAGWETELYQLGGKPIRGCIACMKCWENQNNKCVIDNDKLNEVFEKMLRADAVVIGTPIDLARIINIEKPNTRVYYDLQEIGSPNLEGILAAFVSEHNLA